MFRGRYEHTIDPKGRVSVPSRFRDVLKREYGKEVVILTPDDSCIAAFPFDEWKKLEKKALSFPFMHREAKVFLRYYISGAVEINIDDHGRLLIPLPFRDHAQLKKDVVFVGMLNRFEIWDKEIWVQELARYRENFEKTSEAIAEWMVL